MDITLRIIRILGCVAIGIVVRLWYDKRKNKND